MTFVEKGDGRVRLAPGVRVDEGALSFHTSRSSGPGGQNVNKRDTKVELRVPVDAIPLSREARSRLTRLAGDRVTESGELRIECQETRSQRRNRDIAVDRLRELVVKALKKPKRRIRTKPTKASQRRRVEEKVARGQRKRERQRNRGRGLDE